jgi:hypothetical protein
MGLGCVLIVWGALACVGATMLGVLLVGAAATRKSGPLPRRLLRSIGWFAVPFLYVVYFAVAYLLYAGVCELRGYDPALGDGWYLPLGHHYEFQSIDTWEQCSVDNGGESVVYPVREIGREGDFVFGQSAGRYFVIRTSDGRRWDFADAASMQKTVHALGVRDVELEDVSTFYSHNRWGFFDLAAGLLIVGGAAALTIAVALFINWQRARAAQR